MRYLLLIHSDETVYPKMTEQETAELMSAYDDFTESAKSAGALLGADRLRPSTTATTVRVRNTEVLATDGPFAETKEQLGGYYMIEAADLDEAIGWAAKIPSAKYGSIEVRPVWD
ncbi:MAG: YciI family protein [Planctomycetota bacterium]|nr:YciI family protein [Planctomycetota bacterium]